VLPLRTFVPVTNYPVSKPEATFYIETTSHNQRGVAPPLENDNVSYYST
jgi:hypothetical protein